MTIQGKGFFIWKIPHAEGGDPQRILAQVKEGNLSHVIIKVADGETSYNVNVEQGIDLVAPIAQLLQSQGVQVWGWQYIYGNNPLGEARTAIHRIRELNLDGFVADAEHEYKDPGKDLAARKYMSEIKEALPDTPIAISSYRFPSYHPEFPYTDFLEYADMIMPQVYWEHAHNARLQLVRTVREFQNLGSQLPIIPTGSAYGIGSWQATPADVIELLDTAKKETLLKGANFWVWEYTRANLMPVWDAIRDYDWPTTPQPKDLAEQYIDALNEQDGVKLTALYNVSAAHINFQRTIQGQEEINHWYDEFLTQLFPDAVFKLTSYSGSERSRQISWTATSSVGKILNGNDSIGLHEGKISYHYTHFSIIRV
ncbi:MAG: hypothetical protein N2D54_12510 [Chloroflexota bacterium]